MTVYELTNETVTFEDLSSKLSNDSLTVFRLKDVKVSGSERDAINMSKTIRGHPNLQEFSLTNVEVLDAAVDLDPVVSMLLVTVTTLKTLRLENAPITMSALSTIGYCTTLKELFMPNSGLKDEDATIIAAGIAQNQSIETVDLTGNGCWRRTCRSRSSVWMVTESAVKAARLFRARFRPVPRLLPKPQTTRFCIA